MIPPYNKIEEEEEEQAAVEEEEEEEYIYLQKIYKVRARNWIWKKI